MRIELNKEDKNKAYSEIYNGGSEWHEDYSGNIYSDVNALILSNEEHESIQQAQKEVVSLLKTVQSIIRNDSSLNEWFVLPENIYDLANINILDAITTYGRFDWVFTNGYLQLLEFNSETPMGWVESINYTNKAHKYFDKFLNCNKDLEAKLESSIRKTLFKYNELGKGNIAIIGDLDDAEENETFQLLKSITERVNPNVTICSVSDLRVITGDENVKDGVYIYNSQTDDLTPVHILQTFYSVEWMAEDEGGEQLVELLESGKVGLMNPVSTLQLHSKSIFALIWFLYNETNLLNSYQSTIENYIPYTSFNIEYFTEEFYNSYDKVVIKPINHREGDGIEIKQIKNVKQSEEYDVVYQEYLDVDKITHIRNNTVKGQEIVDFNHTIGVFCIDDRFGGYYTRLSEGICSIYDAVFLPTFVEEGDK